MKSVPGAAKNSSASPFRLTANGKANRDYPTDLLIACMNRSCDFNRDRALPIIAVDEPIYRRLPCFLIATVDKFAGMPWTGAIGGFFGRVQRSDNFGFYGATEPDRGAPSLRAGDCFHRI